MESKEEVIKRLTDNLEVNHRTDSGSQVEQAIWQREEIFSTALVSQLQYRTVNHLLLNTVVFLYYVYRMS